MVAGSGVWPLSSSSRLRCPMHGEPLGPSSSCHQLPALPLLCPGARCRGQCSLLPFLGRLFPGTTPLPLPCPSAPPQLVQHYMPPGGPSQGSPVAQGSDASPSAAASSGPPTASQKGTGGWGRAWGSHRHWAGGANRKCPLLLNQAPSVPGPDWHILCRTSIRGRSSPAPPAWAWSWRYTSQELTLANQGLSHRATPLPKESPEAP